MAIFVAALGGEEVVGKVRSAFASQAPPVVLDPTDSAENVVILELVSMYSFAHLAVYGKERKRERKR
jgi:hypothetical protein